MYFTVKETREMWKQNIRFLKKEGGRKKGEVKIAGRREKSRGPPHPHPDVPRSFAE